MPGDHHAGAGFLFAPSHGPEPCLQAAAIGLNLVVGVPLGAMPGRLEQVVNTVRSARARSVTTSIGVTLVVVMACLQKRRAAASRCVDRNTSMTCPGWSIARWTSRQRPAT